MVALFTQRNFQTGYTSLLVLFKIVFKVVQIYLVKDMSQTVCVYFFYFVTGSREKLMFDVGGHEKVVLGLDTMKK